MWINLGLKSGNSWVAETSVVKFRGRVLTLTPEDDAHLPSLFMEYGQNAPEKIEVALAIVREFLSDLCWASGKPMRENRYHESSIGGRPIKKLTFADERTVLELDFLIDPQQPQHRLAVGLFREATNTTNVYHSFVNYFRIINITQVSASAQKRWINEIIDELQKPEAKLRVETLKASGVQNIGLHMVKQGRCALAHSGAEEPAINPDDSSDELRIREDLPLMRELARLLMTQDFQLLTREDMLKHSPHGLEHPENVLSDQRATTGSIE